MNVAENRTEKLLPQMRELPQPQEPVMTESVTEELTKGYFRSVVLSMCYPASWGADGMEAAPVSSWSSARQVMNGAAAYNS